MDVSVIILNYNTKRMTADCIRSVYAHTQKVSFEVIVMDNASTDGSKEALADLSYENYTYIYNPVNEGFSRGNNRAADRAKGRFLLFLNNDILLKNDVAGILSRYLLSHPEAGIAGPKFLNPDGSLQVSCRNFPNILFGVWRFFPFLRRVLKKQAQNYYQDQRDYTRTQWVDTVSAGALMISRTLFDRIGKFDPFSFMYAEDADICRQVRDLGKKVVYCPEAVLVHFGGQSTRLNSYRAVWSYYDAFYRLYQKYYFGPWAILVKPVFRVRAVLGVIKIAFQADKRITWNKK